MVTPTSESYGELQSAFDHFNRELFGNSLPTCLLTLQRKKRTRGYYSPHRFANGQGKKTDEIAMNPQFFAVVSVMSTLSTLAHEMTHLWQEHFGTKGRRGYHNKEWGCKMKEIGLMPSNTGKPGGRETGEQMTHYIIEGGAFEESAKRLLDGEFGITWKDRYPDSSALIRIINNPEGDDQNNGQNLSAAAGVTIDTLRALDIPVDSQFLFENNSNRSKYSCGECGVNAWGKPGLHLVCGDCQVNLSESGF